MSPAVTRPYAGAADLRRMQAAVSALFGRGTEHVGNLAWQVRNATHLELGSMVTLVESQDGELLGWTWVYSSGWFDAVPVVDAPYVAEALVASMLATSRRCLDAGDQLEKLSVLCDEEDAALAGALGEAGFAPLDQDLEITRRSLEALPTPDLPAGLRFASLEDDTLLDARIEAHRAAFAPSSLTVLGYRRSQRTWPYRPELDRVVVDEEGRVLSACLAWIDEARGWGLLEPVGTRPEHQRRGLGAAVCLDALHALRRAGAHSAQVACESGAAGCATYHSIGFRTERRMKIHRRAAA